MRILWLMLAAALTLSAAEPPKSVRLYVLDCGRLAIDDPARLGFKKEQLKTVDLSMGCYLIVHPRSVLLWHTQAESHQGIQFSSVSPEQTMAAGGHKRGKELRAVFRIERSYRAGIRG